MANLYSGQRKDHKKIDNSKPQKVFAKRKENVNPFRKIDQVNLEAGPNYIAIVQSVLFDLQERTA